MENVEVETIHEATLVTHHESAPVARMGNYEPVRFNAMKHGILSKLAVLAHEDHAEFADLLAALIDEHRPTGMTERHLIEELATIIWRKRRVLLAEGAKINEGLKSAVSICPEISCTSSNRWPDGVVPFTMKLGAFYVNFIEFIISHVYAFRVGVGIHLRLNF